MKVADAMQRDVTTVEEGQSLRLAFQVMVWSGIRHLPVVRDVDVVGVLSERDIFMRGRVGESVFQIEGTVKEAMTSPARTVRGEDDLASAIAQMADERLGCLVVLDRHERLAGILTTTDALYLSAVPTPATDPMGVGAAALMTSEPEVAHPDDGLLDAVARMTRTGARHLPVLDGEGRAIGMLSDRDVRSAVGHPGRILAQSDNELPAGLAAMRVRDVMTDGCTTVSTDTRASDVASLLLSSRYGALPVVDAEERVVGIVSYLDVLRQLAES